MLLAAAGGFIVVVLGLLGLPVSLQGWIDLSPRPAGEMEAKWAWGLVGGRVTVTGGSAEVFLRLAALPWYRLKPGAGNEKGRRGHQARRFWHEWAGLLTDGELRSNGIVFGRRVLRSLRLRLRLKGVFGTGEPDLTGYLTAAIAAVEGGPVQLDLQPDFTAARLDVQGQWRAGMIPLPLLWYAARFFLSRPVRRIWWSQKGKRKAKI